MTDLSSPTELKSYSGEPEHARRSALGFALNVGISIALMIAAAMLGLVVWKGSFPRLSTVVERGWSAYQGRNAKALQQELLLASRISENSKESRLLRGLFLLTQNQAELALAPLRDASQEPSLRSRALLGAAAAYLALNQYVAAEQVLTECLREDRENVETHRLAAVLYYDLGANPAAIEHLEAVARLAPEDARPWRLIGLMRKDFQDYTAAAAAYREALQRLAGHPEQSDLAAEVRLELAQSLTELRQYEAALAALSADDQAADTIAIRLHCLRALNQKDAATAMAQTARQIPNPTFNLTLELGNHFDAMNQLELAQTYFEQAIKQDPLDFIPRYKLSNIYARQGQKEKAAAELKAMQANRERYDRLHALQNQAMQEPLNAQLHYEMGDAARDLGRLELARVWYTAALGIDPEHQKAKSALQKLPPTTDKSAASSH